MEKGEGSLICLDRVTKVFLTEEIETRALSEIHFEIREGEYVSIAGPSGCGKSTLLSILGLLDTPTDGKYTLKGRDVTQLSPHARSSIRNQEIGFIFQAFNLIGDLSVQENVELPLSYGTLKSADHWTSHKGSPVARSRARATSNLSSRVSMMKILSVPTMGPENPCANLVVHFAWR